MNMEVKFSESSVTFGTQFGEVNTIHGKSAYEIAVANGFEGTEQEWLESLKGDNYNLTDADKEEIAALAAVQGGINFTTDETLTLKNGVLSVNTATEPEPDNTLPITSAAVHTTVGNIEVLLGTI